MSRTLSETSGFVEQQITVGKHFQSQIDTTLHFVQYHFTCFRCHPFNEACRQILRIDGNSQMVPSSSPDRSSSVRPKCHFRQASFDPISSLRVIQSNGNSEVLLVHVDDLMNLLDRIEVGSSCYVKHTVDSCSNGKTLLDALLCSRATNFDSFWKAWVRMTSKRVLRFHIDRTGRSPRAQYRLLSL